MSVIRLGVMAIGLAGWTSALGAPSDPTELLKQAQTAARQLEAVSYDAQIHTEGMLAQALRDQDGQVLAARSPTDIARVHVVRAQPEGNLELICDGKNAWLIDHQAKEFARREGDKARRMLARSGTLILWDLVSENPYKRQIEANSAACLGAEKVAGVECDIVSVVVQDGKLEERWYFGHEDHLPRRVERILSDEVGGGKLTFTLSSLEPNPPLPDGAFEGHDPEGYGRLYLEGELKPVDPATLSRTPRRAGEPGALDAATSRPVIKLLEVGAQAPDWSLKTPEGETVRLSGLHGHVVVLNFWASWRPACKDAMSSMQKIHEHYGKRGVFVYGLSALEPDDPAKIMKKGGFTYGLLLGAEALARDYGVKDFPVVYIIGPDRTVLYAVDGPGNEAKMREVIDDALKAIDKGK